MPHLERGNLPSARRGSPAARPSPRFPLKRLAALMRGSVTSGRAVQSSGVENYRLASGQPQTKRRAASPLRAVVARLLGGVLELLNTLQRSPRDVLLKFELLFEI